MEVSGDYVVDRQKLRQTCEPSAEIKVQVTIASACCWVGFAMGMVKVRVPLFQLVNGVGVKSSQITTNRTVEVDFQIPPFGKTGLCLTN